MIITFPSFALWIIAIVISYRTWQESQKFGSTMIAQMDTLSHLFTKVNEQISYLPASVSGFDSTIRKLDKGISDQQQEFQKSIGGLQSNIDAFSKGIADYGRTLAKIVIASDKQLVVLDSRQKLLEQELMKNPKLKLQVKGCVKDTLGRLRIAPKIVNEDNEIATFCRILLKIPARFGFESSGYIVWDSTASVQAWSYEFSEFVPCGYGITVHNPKIDFTIKVLPHAEAPYKFRCFLYHNKGVDADTLVIDPSNCQ